jgi:hypothetical protein
MTKLKGLVFKFYNETYRQYVLITFDAKKFERMTGGESIGDAGGCVAIIPGHPLTMWLDMDEDDKIDMTDAAHESFHVADFLANMVGMEYVAETGNEHIAYLLGWVMGCVLEAQFRQQVNDGLKDLDGNDIDESSEGFTVIQMEADDDILDMLERSSRAWDEKCREDGVDDEITTREDLAKAIELLNQDSQM